MKHRIKPQLFPYHKLEQKSSYASFTYRYEKIKKFNLTLSKAFVADYFGHDDIQNFTLRRDKALEVSIK